MSASVSRGPGSTQVTVPRVQNISSWIPSSKFPDGSVVGIEIHRRQHVPPKPLASAAGGTSFRRSINPVNQQNQNLQLTAAKRTAMKRVDPGGSERLCQRRCTQTQHRQWSWTCFWTVSGSGTCSWWLKSLKIKETLIVKDCFLQHSLIYLSMAQPQKYPYMLLILLVIGINGTSVVCCDIKMFICLEWHSKTQWDPQSHKAWLSKSRWSAHKGERWHLVGVETFSREIMREEQKASLAILSPWQQKGRWLSPRAGETWMCSCCHSCWQLNVTVRKAGADLLPWPSLFSLLMLLFTGLSSEIAILMNETN